MQSSEASLSAIGIGTVLDQRYELVREIGRGGCAVVYEAHDHRLHRVVAIKLPLGAPAGSAHHARERGVPTMKTSRFTRESRVIASIHHPNVCAVLDTGVMEDGTPFLVMERLFGESLRSSITRSGRLGLHEAISVALQLLSGLDAVHRAGIVHRDVKPDNLVLVTRYGCDPIVKLLDFGLCRRADARPAPEETMTREGAIVGTPEYMAPEQVMGCTSLDVRVDIYAAGVLLYETLTGDRAFFARSVREILSAVMQKKIPTLRHRRPDAPASLEAVVRRAMDRNPARRYRSCAEFQEALHAVKAELNAAARAQRRPVADGWELPTTRYVRSPSSHRIRIRATGTDG
jgi:eukaryotic-like serine/threonine-protein kinase